LPLLAITYSLALALSGMSSAARAQTVVPIPPTPPPRQPTQAPKTEAPPDLTGIAGKPITRVVVVLEGNVWDDVETPTLREVKVGDPLTPELVRRALGELLGAGRFARARATAAAENGGVALGLRAAPRKLIKRLDLDLHGAPLERDELLREADLAEGGEIVGADIGETSARIGRYFALHGYPSAKVSLQARATDDPSRAFVLVDVTPGPPRLVQDRYTYVFGAAIEQLRPLAETYPVGKHDRADEPALDAADVTLEQALRSKGWYRADVSHDLVWVGLPEADGRVVLRVRVDAGPRQLPRFEGNDHYDTETLTAALALETEPNRSLSHLSDKLRAFYQRRGFLDVQVRPEVRGAETDPMQLMVFHIEEQRRVRVAARRYPCLKVDAIKNLTNGGPRSSGEIGTEIDSFLEDELPGADLFVDPDPRGLTMTIGPGTGPIPTGARPEPIDLHPNATYVADTYDRAVEHVRDLYRNEGFLHAEVGPVQILRARCDPRSPPNRCIALPPPRLSDVCTYGPTGLPLPTQPLDPSFTCRPDPGHGVDCAAAMDLVIPVKLGPRTRLWDVAFTGVRSVSEEQVAEAAQLPLGQPVSTTKLDDARRRIVDWYKELGYTYADVKYTLEPSPDNTRARIRFDLSEGPQVIVHSIEIRGLVLTRESVVRRRIALELGQPYRTKDVEKTRERIDTLGVFSSVTVSLGDPYVPQSNKTVYIDVVERLPRYIELRPGFSTGEGVRGTVEYDERNVLGYAIGAVFRAQLSYVPDFLILDSQVAANYQQIHDRLARRITLSGAFPEVGLGPQVRAQGDAIYVRDLERDFAVDKISGFASLIYRPAREITVALGQSVEDNDVRLFQFNSVAAYLACNMQNSGFSSGLAALLRVPDGESLVVAQRLSFAWDRRDNSFNAHRGTFLFLGAEVVNTFPEGGAIPPDVTNLAHCAVQQQQPPAPQAYSHFVRLSQTLAGYIPIFRNLSVALELRLGENVRTAACRYVNPAQGQSYPALCTYPDRLFFMGGFDSMRGWLQDTFIPQEYVDEIVAGRLPCTSSSNACLVPVRGGNLMINPRVEVRFPLYGAIDGAIFADFGNLWVDPTYVYDHSISLRADVGPGVRLQTPVGPLVFDYGINVSRRSYEDFGAFHFAIGLF
jgi:outer membrane protein assembly factor BamA